MPALPSIRSPLWLSLILLLALLLRLYGLDWGLPNRDHPFNSYHPDEEITLQIAEFLYQGRMDAKHFMYGGTLFFSMLHVIVLVGASFKPRYRKACP